MEAGILSEVTSTAWREDSSQNSLSVVLPLLKGSTQLPHSSYYLPRLTWSLVPVPKTSFQVLPVWHCEMLHNRNLKLDFPCGPLPSSETCPWPLPRGSPGKPAGITSQTLQWYLLWVWQDSGHMFTWWAPPASCPLLIMGHWPWLKSMSCQVQPRRHWELSPLSFVFLGFMLMDPFCHTWWVMGLRNQMINSSSDLMSLSQAEKRAGRQKRRNS